MKASQLVELLNIRIQEHGDLDVMLDVQTGPDSFEDKPVKTVEAFRVGTTRKKVQFFLKP